MNNHTADIITTQRESGWWDPCFLTASFVCTNIGRLPTGSFSAARYCREINLEAVGHWLGRCTYIPPTETCHLHENLRKSSALLFRHEDKLPQVQAFTGSWSIRENIVGEGNPHRHYSGGKERNFTLYIAFDSLIVLYLHLPGTNFYRESQQCQSAVLPHTVLASSEAVRSETVFYSNPDLARLRSNAAFRFLG